MDAETRRAISKLTRELARTQDELARVKRGSRRPQLGRSSIDTGSLEVRDPETGVTRLRLGWQPDGTVGVVPEGGDPPPAPTRPTVEPIASGLRVWWDGQLLGGAAMPGDFDHVNVYTSAESGFTPGGATFAGTIHRDGGGLPVAPLEIGTRHYARLVGVGTGGVQGPPSEQSSGVPESVTDIEPGSITETEIADDAITSPKISANAVQALHIAAEQIEAGHIQAAAITASKLESDLVLGTRIIAGTPGGARVELDDGGLRGYTGEDELAFAITETGDAIFSGTITGSQIIGSSIHITSPEGAEGHMAARGEEVMTRMHSADGSRAQLIATEEAAEFSAWGNPDAGGGPAGGMTARPGQVALNLYSNTATTTRDPFIYIQAHPGEARAGWSAGNGSGVELRSSTSRTTIGLTTEESDEGRPSATRGVLYALRTTGDMPSVTLQSPVVNEGSGAGRRSSIHVDGTNGDGHDYAGLRYFGNRHRFANDSISSELQTDPGIVELSSTHSILSSRHRYVRGSWLGGQPTSATTSSFVAFSEAEYERPVVQTGASGAVRVTVSAYGRNQATGSSLLVIGFAIGSYGASRLRAAEIRVSSSSTPSLQQCGVFYLDLDPDTSYRLVPYWYLSSGAWGTDAVLSGTGENSIVVEALT